MKLMLKMVDDERQLVATFVILYDVIDRSRYFGDVITRQNPPGTYFERLERNY